MAGNLLVETSYYYDFSGAGDWAGGSVPSGWTELCAAAAQYTAQHRYRVRVTRHWTYATALTTSEGEQTYIYQDGIIAHQTGEEPPQSARGGTRHDDQEVNKS